MNLPCAPHFSYRNDLLHAESVPLPEIAARFGTPVYVYSRAALTDALQEYQAALSAHPAGSKSLLCYAVKANSNLSILTLFARLGTGFDIVSGGELERVLAAGGDPGKIVFSGVGKTVAEMQHALEVGILCFNVESASELERLHAVAARIGKRAPVSLRVNPDVDPKTHPYIATGLKTAKFGIPIEAAPALYERAASLPFLEVTGIDCHIGSQLLDPRPYEEALTRILRLVDQLEARKIPLRHLDLGGGLGIRYRPDETAPSVERTLSPLLDALQGRDLTLILEPGRRLVGNAGLLLTKVEYLKPGADKHFAIVDAAMNDLMRPALYEAHHEIVNVRQRPASSVVYDVVGPICETGDFFGKDIALAVEEGDLIALLSAGAYGMSMSSNYNSRPRAAEVLVDGTASHCIRRRETPAELYAQELPFLP